MKLGFTIENLIKNSIHYLLKFIQK